MQYETSEKTLDRRSFFKNGFTVAAVALAATAVLSNPQTALAVTPALKFADIPGSGDIKVLNFALALEDLEADLYKQALMRLTTGGKNKLGKQINGLNISPNQPDVSYVQRFGVIEEQHRSFLRTTINSVGGPTIPTFKYDFKMQSLSRRQVVELVYTAEVTGVGAYLGAIPFLSSRVYLRAAGAIQGTEARHTTVVAIVLNQLFGAGLDVAPLPNNNQGRDRPVRPDTVLAAISPFIVV